MPVPEPRRSAGAPASAPESGGSARRRDEIDARYQWDLAPVFADWAAWEDAFAAVEASLPGLAGLQGTLGRSAGGLLAGLETVLDARRRLERVVIYANLRSDEDTRDGDHLARRGRAGTLAVALGEAISWFRPELLSVDEDLLRRWLAEECGLRIYGQYLDTILRARGHTLDPPREALLAAAANVTRGAGAVYSALNNADLSFSEIEDEEGRRVELTKGRYLKYLMSGDRRVRQDAFRGALGAYGGVINTMAAALDANVKNHVFVARARGYADTLEAALFPNAIPVEVYTSLVAATREHLPVVHRYTALKARILALPDLQEYDLYVPLFADARFSHGYEEAQALIQEALAPLGGAYGDILRRAFDDGWIDVHENLGKRSGAYSNGGYDTPPYVLLNWAGQLQDTFTLAHELGHSAHTWLAAHHQPYVYGDYPIFTAEVASTANELLLLNHLLQGTQDRRRRLFLLDRHLAQINSTVVRQVMFAEFELRIHRWGERNQTLTADSLGDLYLELLADYWGPAVRLEPALSRLTWARIPHFYYNYYVYQYATAYAAAADIAGRILAGDEGAAESYLGVLRSGCSRYPVPTLQLAGVDLREPAPIRRVYATMADVLDEIEGLIAEEEGKP